MRRIQLAICTLAAVMVVTLAMPWAIAPQALAQDRPTVPADDRPTAPADTRPTEPQLTATHGPTQLTATPEQGRRPTPTPVAGRITGTVIELGSGAPAPGVAVRVGTVLLYTDVNGNYDAPGLPPGRYLVALELGPGQGEPGEPPITLNLTAGATVVQHLSFRAPSPQLTVQPTAQPTVAPSPPAIPAALPATGDRMSWAWEPLLLLAVIGCFAIGLRLRR